MVANRKHAHNQCEGGEDAALMGAPHFFGSRSCRVLLRCGDGQWLHSCSSVAAHHPTVGCLRFAPPTTLGEQPGWEGWATVQFETTLLTSGTARFGIEARGLCGNSTAHVLAAETAAGGRGAAVVVAPVGAPWSGALKG